MRGVGVVKYKPSSSSKSSAVWLAQVGDLEMVCSILPDHHAKDG
jgi:hypothetical protein